MLVTVMNSVNGSSHSKYFSRYLLQVIIQTTFVLSILVVSANVNIHNITRPHLSHLSLTLPTLECQTSSQFQVPPGTRARLAKAPLDQLCTLTRVNYDKNEVVPVGRSYQQNEWEAVAGPYRNLFYDCNEESCDVEIPDVVRDGDVFELRGFARNRPFSREDEAARFFEQATFGVTQKDLEKVRSEVGIDSEVKDYFAKWINEQINEVEITSHRALWRERTAPVYEFNSREGRATRPCNKGSIWRGHAFTQSDKNKILVVKEIQVDLLQKRYALLVDDKIRTMVDDFSIRGYNKPLDFSKEFKICRVNGSTYKSLVIEHRGICRNVKRGNPPIDIEGMPEPVIISGFSAVDVNRRNGRIEQLITSNSVQNSQCNAQNKNVFMSFNNGNSIQYLIFEPRLILEPNLRISPLEDGGKAIVTKSHNRAQCSNAPRTFLNERHCRLSDKVACVSQHNTDSGSLKINPTNLKKLYNEEGKSVYAISQLREDAGDLKSPCSHGVTSRWRKENGRCNENIEIETARTLRQLFLESTDGNPYVRDIYFPIGKECHQNDRQTTQMKLMVEQECWKTTHPDHLNVYDFSIWRKTHPGNTQGFNPIRNIARRGEHRLQFPSSHEMSRWYEFREQFPYVGRLGDSVAFNNLPNTLRTNSIAELFGLTTTQETAKTLVCGSPFETGNIVDLSPKFAIQQRRRLDGMPNKVLRQQKRTVWTMIATSANDQLRQRVAWTLSQIFAVSPDGTQFPLLTESFVTYYDIFVRNAFNNYRDVLKEVAFSPLMAQMLSYLESKSSEFIWTEQRQTAFADENFAREIMQLFSIGLEQLNDDGTTKADSDGNLIPTYNNDDITEYARLWTGFTYQTQRGNTEAKGTANTIDPMAIQLQWRDQLPKMGLDRKYIGDGYPLCDDLPSTSFLRRGAKYRLLGNTTQSDILDTSKVQMIPFLDSSSHLFKLLCGQNSGSTCAFPAVVHLRQNLLCTGIECTMTKDPRILQVDHDVYYEYVRPACVHFPFKSSTPTNIVVHRDGKIALSRKAGSFDSLHSLTYFRVNWQNEEFPTTENRCGQGVCEVWGDRCICTTTAKENAAFESLPTRDQILEKLHVGAFSPYVKKYVYSKPQSGFALLYRRNEFDVDTAFKVKDQFGRTLYLKNMISNVNIINRNSGEESAFAFRNTPSFYDDKPELKDALYETDAGLDHYFYHHNTAPFLSLRFIQRFGISNPSPRFVKVVSKAFQTGRYQYPSTQGSISFGNGKYGDLRAMVAAILLDSESRETLLDYDASFGSIREPVIKVISLMRSMAFSQTDGEFVSLHNAEDIIGQMAHELPSVFSFFLPEYSPPGAIHKASLVSPEAMLSQNSIGLVNGMISLINFGMTNCFGGFGDGQNCDIPTKARSFISFPSTGHLTFVPERAGFRTDYADTVIDSLGTLLTSGRLSEYHRQIIKQAYLEANDESYALQTAQRLMILSPEFHQTGALHEGVSRKRSQIPPVAKVCKNYKAVIHLLLKGGCDSFNMLVPHSQCKNGKDMYAEYKYVRGSIGLEKKSLLPINATSSDQVCDSFGIHEKLPFIKDLYEQKDLAFLAGIGVMSAPVNKHNYESVTKTQLFAHNKVQAEISRLDPHFQASDSGLLGRLADVLKKQKGNNVQAFSVDSTMTPFEGERDDIMKAAVNSNIGFQSFNPSPFGDKDALQENLELLNGVRDPHGSMYAETWSSSLHESIHTSNLLNRAQNSVKLTTEFPPTRFGRQLELVSKMIASKDCRGSNRDIFFVGTGGYDHHANVIPNLEIEFEDLNEGLTSFVNEMKSLPNDIWNDITVVVSSDFGRTLSANSRAGSDHGWSGIGFVMGGGIDGGKILGSYPESLTEQSPLDIGRGRLIPTMPFESSWHAVTEWLDLTHEEVEEVLPNIWSFPDEMLLTKEDVFVTKTPNVNTCSDEGSHVFCTPIDEQVSAIE